MKVLHVAPLTNSASSGLNYSIPALIRAQQRAGAEVALLLSYPQDRYSRQEPFSVFQEWRNETGDTTVAGLKDYDLVVFHSTYIPEQVRIAKTLRRLKIPYIITPRGGMTKGAQRLRWWKKKLGNLLFFNRMVAGASALHCLTRAEEESTAFWGKPIFVVGNGIDMPVNQNLMSSPRADGICRLLYIGRIDFFHKGLDLLLDGIQQLAQQGFAEKLELCIYGPDVGAGSVRLHKVLENPLLKQCVKYSGEISGEAKAQALRSADAFVLTSRFEGHPIAVLEALSYGLPCLLTPGTHMAEEVAHAGAGWKVEANADAMADGLQSLLTDFADDALGEKGEFSLRLAKEYAWDLIGVKVLEEYERWGAEIELVRGLE